MIAFQALLTSLASIMIYPTTYLRLALTLITSCLIANSVLAEQPALKVERLTWAGVKIASKDTTVFIDAVGTDIWNGKAPEGLVPVEAETKRRYALISHTHNDHFDPITLKRVLGDRGYVICHSSIASHIASRGLKVISAALWQPISRGGFVFTPVPANDGFGSEQVSWVITHNSQRWLHAGDTLWHGEWSLIGAQFGPFEAVFLPINAPLTSGDPDSQIRAVMSPAQAVDAAIQLKAKQLVPIHYGFNSPPDYVEVENPLDSARKIAEQRAIKLTHLSPGEVLE